MANAVTKFIPGLATKKTVASVTAALQKTIDDLTIVENESNAEYDRREKEIEAVELHLANLARKNADAVEEAAKAAKVRAKIEALLS